MKTMLNSAILLSLLVPSFAMAGEARNDAPAMPGVMTTAGYKFANQCNDLAFARTDDQDRLARTMYPPVGMVARASRSAANPHLVAVEAASADRGANLAFDTVAAFRNAPLLSSVGASASR
jgi:hypothetical protein